MTHTLHPTSKYCMQAMHRLQAQGLQPRRVLDMGCGSGILSLAAAGLWPQCEVLACDISPQAVADAQRNIDENHLASRVRVVHSDGFFHPQLRASAPYDLIVCNILAQTVMALARDLQAHLVPGGMVLCSGIFIWFQAEIEPALAHAGLHIVSTQAHGQWLEILARRAVNGSVGA